MFLSCNDSAYHGMWVPGVGTVPIKESKERMRGAMPVTQSELDAAHIPNPLTRGSSATSITTNRDAPSDLSANVPAHAPATAPESDCAYSEPPRYFDDALQDAERLMKYAAEVGIDVDADTRSAILQGRAESGSQWTDAGAARLLAALTSLAARLKPVTAESLRACSNEERHAVRGYWGWALGLAAVIVPFSLASFVTSGISDEIRKDVVTANDLAVKLSTQLHPAAASAGTAAPVGLPGGLPMVDVVTELQQFASLIRAIDRRALELNRFVFHAALDPYRDIRRDAKALHDKFQLPEDLPKHLVEAADSRITVYQDVRYFAQSLLDDVSVFYGAVAACLLPVLYALLGTCAYLLRSFEEQMRTRTFTPSVANSARFLIAGIGGAVVGLFNNFTVTQTATLPPLAIAFLVGYAVDVFFSFLEGLLQAFTKSKVPAAPVPSPPAGTVKA
jgi:hypothetical protein